MIMKTKKFVVNPFIRVRLDAPNNSRDMSVILQNAITKKEFSIDDGIFDLLMYCSKSRKKTEILSHFSNSLSDNHDNILDMLINEEILVTQDKISLYKLWDERGWRNALYYHLFTKDNQFADMGNDNDYQVKANILENYSKYQPLKEFFKEMKNGIKLPRPKVQFSSAGKIIFNRRTSRNFSGQPITLQQLSIILHYACQPAKMVREYAEKNSKTNPLLLTLSLYTPFEIYFSATGLKNLPDGIYHYNMRKHQINNIRKGRFNSKMRKIAIGQGVDGCSVVFIITSRFGRYMWRYRNSRALRNLYIECASFAHRFILCATALELKTFITPAIRDSIADKLLKIDGFEEAATYLVAVGN